MNGIYEFSIIKESWLKEKFSLKEGIYIRIDGKNIKGSGNAEREISPIHLLHAYNQLGFVIGQKECMSEKQNEITACPELLDMLKTKDAVITTGAMMCQKTVYEKIIRKSCDYVLTVKNNHPTMLSKSRSFFHGGQQNPANFPDQWQSAW